MSISGISNSSNYVSTQQCKVQKQETLSKPNDKDTVNASLSSDEAVISDLARIKAAAKKPIDDAEIQRRIEVRNAVRDADPSKLLGQPLNPERLTAENEKASKYGPIQSKMLSGKPLTAAEKSFLQENYPEAYSVAVRVEEESKAFREQLARCKSDKEKNQIYMNKKVQLLGAGEKDSGFAVAMLPTLDEIYRSR